MPETPRASGESQTHVTQLLGPVRLPPEECAAAPAHPWRLAPPSAELFFASRVPALLSPAGLGYPLASSWDPTPGCMRIKELLVALAWGWWGQVRGAGEAGRDLR